MAEDASRCSPKYPPKTTHQSIILSTNHSNAHPTTSCPTHFLPPNTSLPYHFAPPFFHLFFISSPQGRLHPLPLSFPSLHQWHLILHLQPFLLLTSSKLLNPPKILDPRLGLFILMPGSRDSELPLELGSSSFSIFLIFILFFDRSSSSTRSRVSIARFTVARQIARPRGRIDKKTTFSSSTFSFSSVLI